MFYFYSQPIKNSTISLNVSETLPQKFVNSSYVPNVPGSFVYPPPGIGSTIANPYEQIAAVDSSMGGWFKEYRDNPAANGKRISIRFFPEMNERAGYVNSDLMYTSLTLPKSQAVRGLFVLEPYYPLEIGEPQVFIFKVTLNGEEFLVRTKGGDYNNKISLSLKRGERAIFEFETAPLPQGVHNLGFLVFDRAYDERPDYMDQAALGQGFLGEYYKVYVGTTKESRQIQFQDWNLGETPNPNLSNFFNINDHKDAFEGTGYPIWKPKLYKPGEDIEYTIAFSNPSPYEREYCVIALLNYNVIPIQDGKSQVCGIVKGGQFGLLRSSLKAPSVPGSYHLQMVRVENPLMKDSYLAAQAQHKEFDSGYLPSSRILLKVEP